MKIERSQYPEICSLYHDRGLSQRAIADRYGVTSQAIGKILKTDPRPTRRAAGHHTRADADARLDRIKAMHTAGHTAIAIAQALSISEQTVSEHLINLGFAPRPRTVHADRSLAVRRVPLLYSMGLSQQQIEARLGLGRGQVPKILINTADDPDFELRRRGWYRQREGRAKALECKGLYESGLSCREIDEARGVCEGSTRQLLKRHYPEVLRSRQETIAVQRRRAAVAANSVFLQTDKHSAIAAIHAICRAKREDSGEPER